MVGSWPWPGQAGRPSPAFDSPRSLASHPPTRSALRLRPRAGSVDAPDVIQKSVKPASRWMIHPRAGWKVVWNYAILVLVRPLL